MGGGCWGKGRRGGGGVTGLACRSARFWELLVGVLKHAAAAWIFHMADLFLITF